ncbi:putative cell wall-binding protein [Clostridium algifaecis]|uniref:Cell wall-binding protein n=1 Tax=Clostridium algifaecis TaxID=1472040 RepID=A0ABS4KU47_9CLOT|nr:cell wall-binding repeat-containing protein [Clostridium algifaecis]MBP2033572.1 putative cell wall-binding protein [Clostridium algifaecis]
MNKKSTKALASATLMSLVLTTALTAGPVKAAAGSATRVSGADRYETAANVATSNWTTSDNVVLVSGQGYADAVSASALAKQLNAPILLTTPDTLSASTSAALTKLQAKNIYVVGGTASVSQSVRDQLKKSYTLTELSGNTRYETNVAVANELVKLGVKKDNVLVVGGNGFSDALSVAPIASAKGEILLLADNSQSDSQGAIDFANGSNVTVVGTSNVISDAIKSDFGSTATRVDGGADRFATNLNVLNNFKSDLKADKLYVANASGNGYADALVASAIAGKTASPLVLVDSDSSDATTNAINYMKGEATKTTDTQIVGGTGVVSDTLLGNINSAIYGTPSTSAQVQSVSAVDLNQIKVVFNQEVDEDTAKDVTNYEVGGTTLNNQGTKDNAAAVNDQSAVAKLQDDNKTVLITLAHPKKQSDSLDVKVKKGILSKDKSQSIPEYTQSNLTFNDTTAPTIASVTAQGNKKITVVFSEPVNFGTGSDTDITKAVSKFKIDGQNVTSFGLDTDPTKGLSKVDDYVEGSNTNANDKKGVWSNKVELYFNSSLQAGSHTLKVSDGDNTSLEDAAAFPFQEATTNFNVDTLTTTPKITSITAEDTGKIYINFDRPMDAKTAKTVSYYGINGDADVAGNNPGAGDIELKNNDTQVKISNVSGLLKKNSNTINITNDVKDAYGNKVADDTREPFTLSEDDTKPDVTSVKTLDNKTIRVTFNKDVSVPYAQNISNYKIKDNGGADITTDATKGITSIKATGNATGSASVFDITMRAKLTDSQYTITIKNIIDTATTPNTMADKTLTFAGATDVAPNVIGAYAVSSGDDASRKAVVYFDKEMDASSLQDLSNYKFKNGSGDTKALPSDTDITVSSDNKSATIKFPSSYTVYTGGLGTNDSAVNEIDVIGVKDSNGNALDVSVAKQIDLATNAPSATINKSAFSVKYDGDDLDVSLKFDSAVDNLDYHDFRLGGIEPTSGYKSGENIVLVFGDGATVDTSAGHDVLPAGFTGTKKIDAVKFSGSKAVLTTIAIPQTTLVSGKGISAITAASNITPYDYQALPKTVADNWNADIDTTSGNGYVDVVFDTPIDPNSGFKTDDFVFTAKDGTNLKATSVGIASGSKNTVRFTFDKNSVNPSYFTKVTKVDANGNTVVDTANTPKITVYAKSTATVRTSIDSDDNYAYYKPSSDDLRIRTITVGVVGAVKGN